MKILHYFLGFPPYRSGGLTKYAYDLMCEQKKQGDEIIAVWPGRMNLIDKRVRFKEEVTKEGINSVEIVNPLPVPLDEGIASIASYTRSADKDIFTRFLERKRPDIIHVHTLMGLYKEAIDAAVDLKIRTVFTTHDFFGICPKVTLYRSGKACQDDHSCADCVACNKTALSMKKVMIIQSAWYRRFKESAIVKVIRKKHRSSFFDDNDLIQSDAIDDCEAEEYRKLRSYYREILEKIDCLHFNSTQTEQIFKKYIKPKASIVMTISHKDIADHRKERSWKWTGMLRLTCLAGAKPYKGFGQLRKALDSIWEKGQQRFVLNVFSPVDNPAPYMQVKEDGFEQRELKTILGNTDVLIAPSICCETFGFTVLEALSYGVPVIVSDHVGAKDIVEGFGEIYEADSLDALVLAIEKMNRKHLEELQESMLKCKVISWQEFVKNNYNMYTMVRV